MPLPAPWLPRIPGGRHPGFCTTRIVLTLAVLLLTGGRMQAQDVPVIAPGHPAFDASVFEPFEAEYEQVGFPFTVRFSRTPGEEGLFSMLMIMEGPEGVGIDHVGHRASDFSFAYRKFEYGRFRPEYLDVRQDGDSLTLRRLPLEGHAEGASVVREPLPQPVFDGTAMYWALAGLPLSEGYAWRMRAWSATEDGLAVKETPPFEVVGREEVTTPDGREYSCWVVSLWHEAQRVRFLNYVTSRPPYLIKQVVEQEGDEPMPVITLKRVQRP